ncbi:MAG: [FeFe] hydrogenase H-cluster radical SAM maturase HydE [Phycisphaerae bacterium]|jgi:biotin synthase
MNRSETIRWLREGDEAALATLWQQADEARRRHVGDEVHLRGLIEISNHCGRDCHYCGIRHANSGLKRYRMSEPEILDCVDQAASFGYGTVVLQSGEDYGISARWMEGLIGKIKQRAPLAVTLSLGERQPDELALWRAAGADRYLLRFETSNRQLFKRIHPAPRGRRRDRIDILRLLRKLGYEVGSGVMVGIPGQTYEDLADDLELFARLDLDMIGMGPYVSHPQTPLGQKKSVEPAGRDEQAPNTELMTYKMIALARLACPRANIPATTALASLNPEQGRELGLRRGANIVMPNLTPTQYRAIYEIYPGKVCLQENADDCRGCMGRRILSIGRSVGVGRGDARRPTVGEVKAKV